MTKRTLIAIALASSLAACSQQESADTYIKQAQTAQQNKQLNSSVIALKNAIKVEPNNGQARYLLGKLYLDQGNALNATKELERAKRAKFDANIITPLLARSYYLSEDFDGLTALASETLALEAKLATSFFKMLGQIRQGEEKAAQQTIALMTAESTTSEYTVLANAFMAYAQQNLAQAQQLAEEGLSLLPGQPETVLLLGNIAAINEDYQLASEHFKKYLKLQPQQRTVELLLANALLKAEHFERAEKHADSILALLPNQPMANYVKAMVRVQSKDYELALRHAELALNNGFNQANLKLVAGVSAFYLKKHEQVLLYLKPLMKFLSAEHFSRKMLVVSQLELGVIEDVASTLGNVEEDTSTGADFYSALSYKLLQAGAQEEAKKMIGAVNVDDNSANQLLKDGMLKMMINDDKALASLERAVELDPELVKAELAIAYMAIKAGDFAKAERIANKWQQSYPEKADGLNLSAAIALKQGNIKVAKKLLEQGVALDNNIYGTMQLAQLALLDGQQAQALELLQQAKMLAPDNIKVLRALLQLDSSGATEQEVVNKINQQSDNDNLIIIYAEALMRKGKVDEALTQLNAITPKVQTPKFFWQLKVAGYRRNQNWPLVKTTLHDWRKVNAYHLEPLMYLAEVHVGEKDFDKALRIVNEGLAQHTESLPLQLIKTEVLIGAKQTAEAKAALAAIADDIAERPIRHGLYGRLALLEQDFANAQSHLDKFYQVQPSARNALLLAGAFAGGENKQQAITVLTKHLEQHSYDARVASVLGSLYLELGQVSSALPIYEQMVKQQPDNIIALNNTAWLYMEQGELAKAKKYVESAFKQAPKLPEVADTYSQILLKSGENKEALSKATLAFKQSQGRNIDIKLNYIELLVLNNRVDRARKLLQETNAQGDAQIQKKSRIQSMIK